MTNLWKCHVFRKYLGLFYGLASNGKMYGDREMGATIPAKVRKQWRSQTSADPASLGYGKACYHAHQVRIGK